MSKKAATIGVIAGLGVLTGTILLATRAKAAPPAQPEQPSLVPTVDNILASQTMGDLDVYYMYIGQLYFTGQIDRANYETLYQAYVTRYYQLIGANQ